MRATFVALGSILIVIGIFLIPYVQTRTSQSKDTWHEELRRAEESIGSFQTYLWGDTSYELRVSYWIKYPERPGYEIKDAEGNQILSLGLTWTEETDFQREISNRLFSVPNTGRYSFTLFGLGTTYGASASLYRKTISYDIRYSYNSLAIVSAVVLLVAGMTTLVIGLVVKPNTKRTTSSTTNTTRILIFPHD